MIDEYALVAAQQATRTAGPRRHLQSAPVPLEVLRAAITAYLSARSAEPVAWVVTDEDGNVLDFEKLAPFTALPAGGHNLYAHPKDAPNV